MPRECVRRIQALGYDPSAAPIARARQPLPVDGPVPLTPQQQVERALAVMVTTPHIRRYLAERDPQALAQADMALAVAGVLPLPT